MNDGLETDNSCQLTAIRKHYGGIDRLTFWVITLLSLMVVIPLGITGAGVPYTGAVMLIVGIYLNFMRYQNIGRSGWRSLGALLPFIQIFVVMDCYSLPEGYQDSKKMDGKGLLFGIIIGLMLGLGVLGFPPPSIWLRILYPVLIFIKTLIMLFLYEPNK